MQAHHKLSRNSAALAEVLDRLQSGRGQPVVHNVSISKGSHAILGNVTQVRGTSRCPWRHPSRPTLNGPPRRTDRGGSGCQRGHGRDTNAPNLNPLLASPRCGANARYGEALPVANGFR